MGTLVVNYCHSRLIICEAKEISFEAKNPVVLAVLNIHIEWLNLQQLLSGSTNHRNADELKKGNVKVEIIQNKRF